MTAPLWLVRDGLPGDASGIVPLWLESFYQSAYGRQFRGDKQAYWAAHEPRIKAALSRSLVRVACDIEAPEVMWAFVVLEPSGVVHYAVVKRHFASEGYEMLSALLAGIEECTVTHECPDLRRYLPNLRLRYDPFMLGESRQ